ncbi:DUF72 domain-containing protein [Chitinophaga sp. YIM B06452]|uniref:DUF72 domain-containing protein n=1 Tax=Chitinophaga sp. YIM B06452 TaxID=3082158 RepID=UPI0031FE6F01
MKQGKVHIGTSGWVYRHWKGTFYPEDLKQADWFAYFSERFHTVEINNSFYRLPEIKTFNTWRKIAPEGFVYAVKASRFLTHMKKLIVDRRSIDKFFNRALHLEEKLGPVLFQLPPNFSVNAERLETFLQALPEGLCYTFEFRDETWYEKEVYQLLKAHNAAFCIYELQYHSSPLEVTADFIYIRLHGPGKKYQGSYPDATLRKWATFCKKWKKKGKDVYVYFDNDQEGYAAFNALRLAELVK